MTSTIDRWVSGLTMVAILLFAVLNWRDVNSLVAGLANSATSYVRGIATVR